MSPYQAMLAELDGQLQVLAHNARVRELEAAEDSGRLQALEDLKARLVNGMVSGMPVEKREVTP